MEQTITGMDFKIREVAQRIRELREVSGFTVEQMAQRTNLSVEEYIQCEAGKDTNWVSIIVSTLFSLQ